jgi:molybdate transport system substrate-binding protein
MDGGAADELVKRGLARPDGKINLSRSLIGMVVRAGAEKPDIATVDALRNTLLAAKSIAYSDSGSGTYVSQKLFPQLGIADQIAGKTRKIRGPPSGEPVAAVVARGESELGFQQVAELIHVPGVTFVGTLPSSLQPEIFFAGAVTRNAKEPEAATALLQFLTAPDAEPVIKKAGLTPLSD